jgi:hypothetical protein
MGNLFATSNWNAKLPNDSPDAEQELQSGTNSSNSIKSAANSESSSINLRDAKSSGGALTQNNRSTPKGNSVINQTNSVKKGGGRRKRKTRRARF